MCEPSFLPTKRAFKTKRKLKSAYELKIFFAHFGSSLCVIFEMASEIGWQETKIRFFCRRKYPK